MKGFPTRKSSLFLRDEGSKYGTFKNGVRITSEEELSDGDIIKFGQFESEFKYVYIGKLRILRIIFMSLIICWIFFIWYIRLKLLQF